MNHIICALALMACTLPASAAGTDGKAVFQKSCAACHQASGKGIPGAFPALAGNAFVQGPGQEPATVLLKGRGGMPDFSASLSDADLAAVLTYVRTSWGNRGDAMTEQQVAALRTELQAAKFAASPFANKH
ncbi:c-type cytochrome [Pseudoduganella plicata]|uniref:C-type cytochrome n=1 Tax=Pseudoduganella plicata TaxID=321984 RepID=A0A4P7BII7_9BURK|nr:cytochrome c [Pseudoduganella plicata]QBQ38103.1 c-type cytochrome [Pseudoduganella plicata]GGZ02938.1 cytochrome c [Pseudoduganella plicata]